MTVWWRSYLGSGTKRAEFAVRELAVRRPVGGGWVAELVQLPEDLASIALVTFSRGSDTMRARLDLDKKWFIDALPAGVNFKSCEDVVETVLREMRTRLLKNWRCGVKTYEVTFRLVVSWRADSVVKAVEDATLAVRQRLGTGVGSLEPAEVREVVQVP